MLAGAAAADILLTLSLVFGGCCSNALTLEVITSEYAPAGTLITFAQFLIVATVSLRKQLERVSPRVSRSEVLAWVRLEILKSGSTTVHIKGPEGDHTTSFVEELSSYVGVETNREGLKVDGSKAIAFEVKLHADSDRDETHTFTLQLIEGATCTKAGDSDIILDISDPKRTRVLHPITSTRSYNPFNYRLKRRVIPFKRYAFQVLLFLAISLLNNAAFAYHVPMAVHIIFRSGGLVVNMLMGWLIEKRRYTNLQIVSVILVTLGVGLTTLSSKQSKPRPVSKALNAQSESLAPSSFTTYAIGIGILSLALLLSGVLGIVQDRAFDKYGRGNWEEAMFYLHALALPLFAFTSRDLVAQAQQIRSGPQLSLSPMSFISNVDPLQPLPYLPIQPPTLRIPAFYVPLLLNVVTQLFCVAGVNRLTARLNSLTVSLVLVVRKAASLGISILLLGNSSANRLLWVGAVLVLLGTIGYVLGGKKDVKKKEE